MTSLPSSRSREGRIWAGAAPDLTPCPLQPALEGKLARGLAPSGDPRASAGTEASVVSTRGTRSPQGGVVSRAQLLKQGLRAPVFPAPHGSNSLDRFKGLKPTIILLSRGISDAESSWRAGQGWQRKGRLRSVVWARTKPPPAE